TSMLIHKMTGTTRTTRVQLATDTPEVVYVETDHCTLNVHPAEGATVTVELTGSAADDIAAAEALWTVPPSGVVTAKAMLPVPSAITAIRLTCSVGGSVVEITR